MFHPTRAHGEEEGDDEESHEDADLGNHQPLADVLDSPSREVKMALKWR